MKEETYVRILTENFGMSPSEADINARVIRALYEKNNGKKEGSIAEIIIRGEYISEGTDEDQTKPKRIKIVHNVLRRVVDEVGRLRTRGLLTTGDNLTFRLNSDLVQRLDLAQSSSE